MDSDIDSEIERYFENKKNDNSNNKKELALLQQKYIMDLIYYIDMKHVCMKVDIYRDISRSPKMDYKLEMLEKAGIIGEKTVVNAKSPVYYITKKGKSIAKGLREIVDILGEWISFLGCTTYPHVHVVPPCTVGK